ncbi:MAG: hypothetical protein CMD02_02140 [Flavobacteriales bacterium]|nr:hypothetical protein [Flavobacteriales bacterium]
MIKFLWKYKYFNFTIIIIIFTLLLFNISKVNVFFDSERIIELSNVDKNVIKKSLDDSNLLLVGLKLNEKINFNRINFIKDKIDVLSQHEKIVNIKSIFNEKKINENIPVTFPIKILNLNSELDYKKSINKISKLSSNFISSDLKNLLFIIKCENLSTDDEKEKFIFFLENKFNEINESSTFITGQIKSEIYMQKKVIQELLIFTLFTLFLCILLLWYFTKNIYVVFLNLISILISIFFTFSLSNILYDGIELVMIIIPAVIFIITISDFMHLQNISRDVNNKYKFFKLQIQKIGKPVFLTSATTAVGFLSFSFTDFEPIKRFGIITTLSIFLSLFIIVTLYSIFIDLKWNRKKSENRSVNIIISYILNLNSYKKYLALIFITLTIIGASSIKIDNYLTDEINTKSKLYADINYFDNNFGGIKPITIGSNSNIDFNNQKNILKNLNELNFKSDFVYNRNDSFLISARMNDIGSYKSNIAYNKIKEINNGKENLNISGIGYLFDNISNKLTLNILLGLIIAIIIIGLTFVVINDFNYKYFFVALLPNVVPVFTCLGILFFNGFYFSLSNAFILAIVFGLIVDDSIHIISAYSINRKEKKTINESLEYCRKYTFKAVCKTTIVIIVSLTPLLFSEFKSISQLAFITIISATIAVIFDLLFLPSILKKYIK